MTPIQKSLNQGGKRAIIVMNAGDQTIPMIRDPGNEYEKYNNSPNQLIKEKIFFQKNRNKSFPLIWHCVRDTNFEFEIESHSASRRKFQFSGQVKFLKNTTQRYVSPKRILLGRTEK